jgi:hypothetical protein
MLAVMKGKQALGTGQQSALAMKEVGTLVRMCWKQKRSQRRLAPLLGQVLFAHTRTAVLAQHRLKLHLSCQMAATISSYQSVPLVPFALKNL